MENGGCEGRQEPCDPVASEGTKHIDNGHSPLGSVRHDTMKDKMIPLKECSGEAKMK